MNKNNIKYWQDSDYQYAEWSDRALDDDERYAQDSIILVVKTKLIENKNKQEKNINTLMCAELDRWYKETRSGSS